MFLTTEESKFYISATDVEARLPLEINSSLPWTREKARLRHPPPQSIRVDDAARQAEMDGEGGMEKVRMSGLTSAESWVPGSV